MTTIDAPRRAFFGALVPREPWTPSQWAERAPRKLTADESSEPGNWRNDRAPYLTAIMDAACDPAIEEIVTCKGAQIGYSECVRNVVGYWIDLAPGPTLVVMPDQKSAEDFSDERLAPLLDNTPAVRRHLSDRSRDRTVHRVKLDTMSIYLAWAGSSTALKTRPIKNLILEEPDDYPAESGTGGDPIAKAEKRITTYSDKGQAKKLIGGTPTYENGNIWKRFKNCADRRYLWVPCPLCGGFQRLLWGGTGDGPGVKFPDVPGDRAAQANRIESENLACYRCEHCKGEIRDHHKPAMLRRGVWASEGQAVTKDGQVIGPRPKSKRVGFHVSSVYSPWCTFGKLAAEWLLAQNDRQALMDFVNQRLAEPFQTVSGEVSVSVVEEKTTGAPQALVVPDWAVRLIATADTQGKDESSGYFYYVVRAWGLGWRSQLIDAGIVSTKEELYQQTIVRAFPFRKTQAHAQMLVIDSGGPRWQEVYSFAQSAPQHVKPSKGANRRPAWMVEKRPQKDHNIILWEIDSQQAKDQLHLLIHNEDRTLWTLNDRVPADYCKQMVSEHKTIDGRGREAWEIKPNKPANHYWDAEALQVATAWHEGCGMTELPEHQRPSPPPEPSNDQHVSHEWLQRARSRH